MTTYLWELDLEKIPLGWKKTYDEALKSYPNGKIINLNSRVYHNPVQYRERLLFIFNENKNRATSIIHNLRNSNNLKYEINELFKADLILFNVLHDWIIEDDEFSTSLDPRKLDETLLDYNNYFDDDPERYIFFGIERYTPLKLLSVIR